jgi:hypothetical protein
MTASLRFRDAFRAYTPAWLLDRVIEGKTTGYSILWSAIAQLDVMQENAVQGITASYPGLAPADALPEIGRTRGMIRAQGESNDNYAARLLQWWERAKGLGSAARIALDAHTFLSGQPRVRVVNRAGVWVTCDTDGTLSKANHTWDWDSLSNPDFNDPAKPAWSHVWVIIYAMPWTLTPTIGQPGATIGRQTGKGHAVTRNEYQTIRAILNQAKSAHTRIKSVIFTSDLTKFNPNSLGGSGMPDGRWGRWGGAQGEAIPRRDRTCRYWEM